MGKTVKTVKTVKYVLASASPRRKELLEQVGMSFEISAAHGDEVITKEAPEEIVEGLSYQKAMEVARRYEAASRGSSGKADRDKPDGDEADLLVVIGADTIVALGGEIMGKPRDSADAIRMLAKLQNNTHQVYTGVTLAILNQEKEIKTVTFHEKTDVTMYPMDNAQIEGYVQTNEPMDKAGAYAIQGRCAAYIKGINGDYNNVVGLPIARLTQELRRLGAG